MVNRFINIHLELKSKCNLNCKFCNDENKHYLRKQYLKDGRAIVWGKGWYSFKHIGGGVLKSNYGFIFKNSIQFWLYMSFLLFLKNLYTLGFNDILSYYQVNAGTILIQSLVGLTFGALIGIRKQYK